MCLPDLNTMTTGESISIETLFANAVQENEGESPMIYDILPDFLAILIRPVHVSINKETGKEIHTIEEFDATKLADRRELFMDELKVPFFVKLTSDLLNGAISIDQMQKLCLTAEQLSMLKAKK